MSSSGDGTCADCNRVTCECVWHRDNCSACGERPGHKSDCILRHAQKAEERYAWWSETLWMQDLIEAITADRDAAIAETAKLVKEMEERRLRSSEASIKYTYVYEEVDRLKAALALAHPDRAAVVYELAQCQAKLKQQARQLTIMREAAEKKNQKLDAMHYVWCTGPCRNGLHRYDAHPPLTRTLVAAAILNARRLIVRFVNDEAFVGRSTSGLWEMLTGPNALPGIVALQFRLDQALDALRACDHAPSCPDHGTIDGTGESRCTCGRDAALI